MIVMAIMGYIGFRKRTGFHCGLALTDVEQALRRCNALRRAAQLLDKARHRLREGEVP